MPGGAILLAARGPADIELTGNPQDTFFKKVYRRYTQFSYENVYQYFQGRTDFGTKSYVQLDRRGDFVHQMFLNFSLPALNTQPHLNPDYIVSWVNGIGNFIIRNVDIEIGSTRFDRHYGQWLQIWSELVIPHEKKAAYRMLTGYHTAFTPASQPGPVELRVPLFFWFNSDIGLALPLIQLTAQEIRIVFEFQALEDCWVSNTGMPPGLEGTNSSRVNGKISIINPRLMVDYYYLGSDERRSFAGQQERTILIETLQVVVEQFNDENVDFWLDFRLPVKELIWILQVAIDHTDPVRAKDWFDWSDGQVPPGDSITRARILIDNQEVFDWHDAIYFRILQPYQKHLNTPVDKYLYNYSFAIDPEKWKPSGTFDFSSTNNAFLQIRTHPNVARKGAICNIFAHGYNWMMIKNGMAHLLFAS